MRIGNQTYDVSDCEYRRYHYSRGDPFTVMNPKSYTKFDTDAGVVEIVTTKEGASFKLEGPWRAIEWKLVNG